MSACVGRTVVAKLRFPVLHVGAEFSQPFPMDTFSGVIQRSDMMGVGLLCLVSSEVTSTSDWWPGTSQDPGPFQDDGPAHDFLILTPRIASNKRSSARPATEQTACNQLEGR